MICKSEIEQYAHIINEAANRALDLVEFGWIVEISLELSNLPDHYKVTCANKHLLFTFWNDYKKFGYVLRPKDLMKIEKMLCG